MSSLYIRHLNFYNSDWRSCLSKLLWWMSFLVCCFGFQNLSGVVLIQACSTTSTFRVITLDYFVNRFVNIDLLESDCRMRLFRCDVKIWVLTSNTWDMWHEVWCFKSSNSELWSFNSILDLGCQAIILEMWCLLSVNVLQSVSIATRENPHLIVDVGNLICEMWWPEPNCAIIFVLRLDACYLALRSSCVCFDIRNLLLKFHALGWIRESVMF